MRGQATVLSKHLKDPAAHTIKQLLDAGYEAWFMTYNNSKRSEEIVKWLLAHKYVIVNPDYRPKLKIPKPIIKTPQVENVKKR